MRYPERYPDFKKVKKMLPQPELIEIFPDFKLDVLHTAGQKPALVFIHGGLGNLWNHYAQFSHFYQRQEILAYSLAGNGNSDQHIKHSLQTHIDDLKNLLTLYEIQRPILCGWSYGTALVLEYSKKHPVDGLIFTGGAAFGMTPAWELPMMKIILFLRLYKIIPGGPFMKQLASWAVLHPNSPDRLLDEVLKTNPFPRRRSAWKTVVDDFWNYDGRENLDRIQVPSLVVHGPADRIVPIERAKKTAEMLPRCKFIRLSGTGHAAPVERYDRYNQFIEYLIQGSHTFGRSQSTL
ncbi:MAG: alpha/beta fold hydrolase [Gammaproteobacteria bacterium]|nr:alpha/beta fold hydrolase [Gammaproteobacteria bacterium]